MVEQVVRVKQVVRVAGGEVTGLTQVGVDMGSLHDVSGDASDRCDWHGQYVRPAVGAMYKACGSGAIGWNEDNVDIGRVMCWQWVAL